MNDTARRIMRDRLMRREDHEYDRRGYDGRRDYGHEHHEGREYHGDYRRGRRDYGEDYMDRRDYAGDYHRDYDDDERRRNRMGRFTDRDYREDMGRHGGKEMYLMKEDAERWVRGLKNEDGTHGAHFEKGKVREAMRNMGLDMSEEEVYATVNMLYSDYCAVHHPYISHEPEKELNFYLKMAKAFLEDKDGPEPSEKLALYYYCIVEDDD